MKQKYTITAEQYAEYQELKQARRDGHLHSADTLRMIVRACEFEPEKVGRHFLQVCKDNTKNIMGGIKWKTIIAEVRRLSEIRLSP